MSKEMIAKYLPTAAQSGQKNKINILAEQGIRFRPFVRKGLMTSIKPALINDQLIEFQNHAIDQWESWKHESIEIIWAHIKKLPYDTGEVKAYINEKEKVWTREEDEIFFIDFPSIIVAEGSKKLLEIRVCIGLCQKAITTKYWARICLPSLKETPDSWIPIDYLHLYSGEFRNITTKLCKWICDKSNIILTSLAKNTHKFNEQQVGWLEVSAFGLNDHKLIEPFKKLDDYLFTSKDLINISTVDERLSTYMQAVTDINYPLGRLINEPEFEQDFLWSSSGTMMKNMSGDTEEMHIFFMERKYNKMIQVVGFGPDYSDDGELARHGVRKISSYIYKRI